MLEVKKWPWTQVLSPCSFEVVSQTETKTTLIVARVLGAFPLYTCIHHETLPTVELSCHVLTGSIVLPKHFQFLQGGHIVKAFFITASISRLPMAWGPHWVLLLIYYTHIAGLVLVTHFVNMLPYISNGLDIVLVVHEWVITTHILRVLAKLDDVVAIH